MSQTVQGFEKMPQVNDVASSSNSSNPQWTVVSTLFILVITFALPYCVGSSRDKRILKKHEKIANEKVLHQSRKKKRRRKKNGTLGKMSVMEKMDQEEAQNHKFEREKSNDIQNRDCDIFQDDLKISNAKSSLLFCSSVQPIDTNHSAKIHQTTNTNQLIEIHRSVDTGHLGGIYPPSDKNQPEELDQRLHINQFSKASQNSIPTIRNETKEEYTETNQPAKILLPIDSKQPTETIRTIDIKQPEKEIQNSILTIRTETEEDHTDSNQPTEAPWPIDAKQPTKTIRTIDTQWPIDPLQHINTNQPKEILQPIDTNHSTEEKYTSINQPAETPRPFDAKQPTEPIRSLDTQWPIDPLQLIHTNQLKETFQPIITNQSTEAIHLININHCTKTFQSIDTNQSTERFQPIDTDQTSETDRPIDINQSTEILQTIAINQVAKALQFIDTNQSIEICQTTINTNQPMKTLQNFLPSQTVTAGIQNGICPKQVETTIARSQDIKWQKQQMEKKRKYQFYLDKLKTAYIQLLYQQKRNGLYHSYILHYHENDCTVSCHFAIIQGTVNVRSGMIVATSTISCMHAIGSQPRSQKSFLTSSPRLQSSRVAPRQRSTTTSRQQCPLSSPRGSFPNLAYSAFGSSSQFSLVPLPQTSELLCTPECQCTCPSCSFTYLYIYDRRTSSQIHQRNTSYNGFGHKSKLISQDYSLVEVHNSPLAQRKTSYKDFGPKNKLISQDSSVVRVRNSPLTRRGPHDLWLTKAEVKNWPTKAKVKNRETKSSNQSNIHRNHQRRSLPYSCKYGLYCSRDYCRFRHPGSNFLLPRRSVVQPKLKKKLRSRRQIAHLDLDSLHPRRSNLRPNARAWHPKKNKYTPRWSSRPHPAASLNHPRSPQFGYGRMQLMNQLSRQIDLDGTEWDNAFEK